MQRAGRQRLNSVPVLGSRGASSCLAAQPAQPGPPTLALHLNQESWVEAELTANSEARGEGWGGNKERSAHWATQVLPEQAAT